jgi:putative membrane protein
MKRIAFVILILAATACSSNLDYNEANQRNKKTIESEELKKDARFLVDAKSYSLLLLEMSELAAETGYSSNVQAFATKLQKDHERLNQQLKEIAGNQNIKLPREMSETHQAILQDLQNADRKEFDRRFVRSAERLYEDSIDLFKNIATAGANDNIRAFAAKSLGVLRANQQRADELEDQII